MGQKKKGLLVSVATQTTDTDLVSPTQHKSAPPAVASILVVDDDPIILDYIRLHLTTADFEVRTALSVDMAMSAIATKIPDLVISDISMPSSDGFDFLTKLRANPDTEKTPFIFLTQHNDVDVMRRGMQLGANDFLSKPIRRKELLSAISGRLKILEGLRLAESREAVPTLNIPVMNRVLSEANANAGPAPNDKTQLLQVIDANASPEGMQKTVEGTVLFSDIRSFATIAERLNANEVAELLNAYFAVACEPILTQRGWVVKFVGDGVIAMFDSDATPVPHQTRAMKAALLITVAASQFQTWIEKRFPGRDLPRFAVGVGLHCGDVSVTKWARRK